MDRPWLVPAGLSALVAPFFLSSAFAEAQEVQERRARPVRTPVATVRSDSWQDAGVVPTGGIQLEIGESSTSARPIDGIRDNSFLIEEAYNQEAGVVQHIWTARFGADHRGAADARTWDLSFTQEWPVFSQDHQLSYTVPYSFVDEDAEHAGGLGDILLHYRYQLFLDEPGSAAFAPRVSLILPSGQEERGFGIGVLGYQFQLPVSKTLTDRLYLNVNAGLTFFPDAALTFSNRRHSEAYDLLSFNLGGSVIYAVTDTFHLLLEAVWNSDETLLERESAGGRRLLADRRRIDDVVLSPGLRWAMNLPGDMQIVPGLAFPIGLTDDSTDYGAFFYLSVEHSFVPQKR